MIRSSESRDVFDPGCTRCPRLAAHLKALRVEFPNYHNAPVPAFGDPQARLLIVGLAPGMHGANATGRPFTGDFAGILLYRSLFDVGLASAPASRAADDGLQLQQCRITNAVKCLPPANKPIGDEIAACNSYLRAELTEFGPHGVLLALGGIAHRAVLRAFGLKLNSFLFAHGAEHQLPSGHLLIDSYHCSRYNTQTRRLTEPMFRTVLAAAKRAAAERA